MKTKITSSCLMFLSILTFACSNGSDEHKQDHVFKGYEKAYEKAKQLQPQMDEAEEKRRKQIEDSMR